MCPGVNSEQFILVQSDNVMDPETDQSTLSTDSTYLRLHVVYVR